MRKVWTTYWNNSSNSKEQERRRTWANKPSESPESDLQESCWDLGSLPDL